MVKSNRKTRKTNHAILLFIAIVATFSLTDVYSQARINSPYSMFGPGEIKGDELFRNMSMGGIAQGFRSNVAVNYLNPASYTALDSLSFVFEGTVFSHIYQQQQAGQEQTSNHTAMGNLNFAFPVMRGWSFAAGLLPWSMQGYRITDGADNDVTGRVNYLYEGSGGINKVYIGNAFNLYRGLSAGINLSYLFGKTEQSMTSSSDSAGFYRTAWNFTDETGGIMLTYGLQWQIPFDGERSLTLGASYTDNTTLDMERSSFITRLLPGAPGLDTLNFSRGETGKMEIPAAFSAGAFMRFTPQFAAGIDYRTQGWSNFETYNNTHDLNDAYTLRVGGVYNPRIETYTGYLSRMEYRAGLRYGQSYLAINDNQGVLQDFTELGISFGVGLPLRRSLTAVNLGFEYSQRMSGSDDLIGEHFFRFNFGINIYERWFVRRRFF